MKAWKKIVDVSIAYPQFPSISLIELTYAILDLPPPSQTVHKEGCPIVMQSWHVGRIAHPEMEEQKRSGRPVYAPSAIAARGGKVSPRV